MRMTIIVPDGLVGINQSFFDGFDMSQVPAEVRVLQWYDIQGELEFFDYRPNLRVTELPAWAELLRQQWVVVSDQNLFAQTLPSADNKSKAATFLSGTDWSVLPDVANPTMTNPYLANQAEFIAYRSQLRAIYANPPDVAVLFPERPRAVWQNV